jgi:hypothetical protein
VIAFHFQMHKAEGGERRASAVLISVSRCPGECVVFRVGFVSVCVPCCVPPQ